MGGPEGRRGSEVTLTLEKKKKSKRDRGGEETLGERKRSGGGERGSRHWSGVGGIKERGF